MEPKLQAVQYFLQNSVSKDAKAYITHVSNLHYALVNSKNCSVFGKHIETIIGSVKKINSKYTDRIYEYLFDFFREVHQ